MNQEPYSKLDIEELLKAPPKNLKPRRKRRKSVKHETGFADAFSKLVRYGVAVSTLSMIWQAGPFLLLGLCGLLFCFRGCLSMVTAPTQQLAASLPPVIQPPQSPPSISLMPMRSVPTQPPSGAFPSSQSPPPVAEEAPNPSMDFVPNGRGPLQTEARPPIPIPTFSEEQIQDQLRMRNPYGLEPKQFDMPWIPIPGFHQWPTTVPMELDPLPKTGGMFPGSNFTARALEGPNPIADESHPIFNTKRGCKFEGTSQLQGNPSLRIQLAVGVIRDNGRSISATLSTLEGARITRRYNGTIEGTRLVLIPETHPTSFGTFVTYQSWTSNSPTQIALSLNGTKGLSGQSISGEMFELVAKEEAIRPKPRIFPGFDDPDDGRASIWKVATKNGAEVSDETWVFASETYRFVWKRGNAVIAEGTFKEQDSQRLIDIEIDSLKSPRTYLGIFMPMVDDAHVRVCITKEPSAKRPYQFNLDKGNVFELAREDGEAAP